MEVERDMHRGFVELGLLRSGDTFHFENEFDVWMKTDGGTTFNNCDAIVRLSDGYSDSHKKNKKVHPVYGKFVENKHKT